MPFKFIGIEEARIKAEEEARIKAEAELKAKAEEEARIKAEEEPRIKAEAKLKAKTEEEARIKAEAEAKAEEEARIKAEAKAKAEEEAKKDKSLNLEAGIAYDDGEVKEVEGFPFLQKEGGEDEEYDDLRLGRSLRTGFLQFGRSKKKRGKYVYVPETFDFTTYDGVQEIFKALEVQEPDLIFKFQHNLGIVPSASEPMQPIGLWRGTQFRGEENIDDSDDLSVGNSSLMSPLSSSGYHDDASTWTDKNYEVARRVTDGVKKPFSVDNISHEDDYDTYDLNAFANPGNLIDQERIRQIEGDFVNVLKAVAEFESTAFLITDPFRGNRLSELACKASAGSRLKPPTIGLFHAEDELSPLGQFSILKDVSNIGEMNIHDQRQLRQIQRLRDQGGTLGLWMKRLEFKDTEYDGTKSKARLPVLATKFQNESVPIGEDRSTSIIKVDCNFTKYEERVYKKNNFITHIPGGLANECSHRLIFATEKQKEKFKTILVDFYATGSFACGGTHREIKATTEAIKNGEPLFIVEGTGNVATIANDFIKKEGTAAKKYKPGDCVELLNKDRKDSTMTTRFYCEEALNEGLSLLKSNRKLFNNYNPDACYIIKESTIHRTTDVQVVKDNITRVMATTHDFSNELGGKKKDQEAIDLCDDLIDKADNAKRRYQAQALVLRLCAQLAVILSTVLAVVSIVCHDYEYDINASSATTTLTSAPSSVPNSADRFNEKICPSFPGDPSRRGSFSLALPIFAAALLSIESTFRPRAKYATLLLAQHKLESEKYKFRARVGAYNSFDRSKSRKKNVRKRFMEECKAVFEECSKSEFKDGVLETKWHVLTQIREYFRCTCFSTTLREMKRTKPTIELDYSTGKVTILNPMRRFVEKFKKKNEDGRTNWEISELMVMEKAVEIALDPENPEISTARYDNFTEEERMRLNRLRDLEHDLDHKYRMKSYNSKYRVLSIDDYIRERLLPQMKKFREVLPFLTFSRNALMSLVISLTAATTFLVATHNVVYVPIVLALSAAADAFLVFFQLENVTPVLHVAYSELRSILFETTGPTTLETRLISKKTVFVQRTEAAILSYYEHMANATLRLERSNQDEDSLEEQRKKLEKSFSKKRL